MERDPDDLRETITSVMSEYPVRVGILFGSHARGDAAPASDVDVAVVFEEGTQSGTRFDLGAALAIELETDDVDVIDLETASGSIARTVFRDGQLLVGTEDEARRLRARLVSADETRPLEERLDDAIEAIDDHLA